MGYVLLLEKREERKRRDLAEPERLPQIAASEVPSLSVSGPAGLSRGATSDSQERSLTLSA